MNKELTIHDFDYNLPEELIAQHPTEKRENSKLMHISKNTISHHHFFDIINFLNKGDCLVLNETLVLPARLLGKRPDTNGQIEFVLLKELEKDTWQVLAKPGRRAIIGREFVFGDNLKAKVTGITETGERIIKLEYDGIFEEVLDQVGIMPLPPYITETLNDKNRYQTVYAKHKGSAAAPTAGLHFTDDLLKKISDKGINIARVTLHVGIGTFRPVKTEKITDHNMHSEWYNVSQEAADIINTTKQNGGKVICVGTTSTRTLESVASDDGIIKAKSGETDIFIYPGYKFKIVDKLITNFHLPKSTLLMLVSALCGKEKILKAYNVAIENNYRFFSFGDAMLIEKDENV